MTSIVIHKTSRACECAPARFVLILQNCFTKEIHLWHLFGPIDTNPLRYEIVLEDNILPGEYNYYLCNGGNVTYANVDPNDPGDIYICNLSQAFPTAFSNGIIAQRSRVSFSHNGKPLTIGGVILTGGQKPNCIEADKIRILERGVYRVADCGCDIASMGVDLNDYYTQYV